MLGRLLRKDAGKTAASPATISVPLRGRLMVGRLTLDQVVKVRVLAPQPHKIPASTGFVYGGGNEADRLSLVPAGFDSMCPYSTASSRICASTFSVLLITRRVEDA